MPFWGMKLTANVVLQEQVIVEKIYVSRFQSNGTDVYEYPRRILTQGPQVYAGQEHVAYPAPHQHKHQHQRIKPPRSQRHNQHPGVENHGPIPSCCACHSATCSPVMAPWVTEPRCWGRGQPPAPMLSEMHSGHTRNCQQQMNGPPHPHQVNHTQHSVIPPGMVVPEVGMNPTQKRSYVHQKSTSGVCGLQSMGNTGIQPHKMRDRFDTTKGTWGQASKEPDGTGISGTHQNRNCAAQLSSNHPVIHTKQHFHETTNQVHFHSSHCEPNNTP